MRYFLYVEPTGKSSEPTYTIMSEGAVLADYWEYWVKWMMKANKELDYSNIEVLQSCCIDDFCTVHWATELTKDSAVEWVTQLLEPTENGR